MDLKKCDILEQKMCHELEEISGRLLAGQDMTTQDLDRIDKLFHALKSMATYRAMKEAGEHESEGYSGYRNQSGMNRRSYDKGYSQGYAEGQMSGHYPTPPFWGPEGRATW